ncbi:MAG TPA: hypothetical protein PLX06_06890, partial [Fimbriimonadaceae bacterium]|nr:hypothetical protein [Fimbriimonadaceae bacterium]
MQFKGLGRIALVSLFAVAAAAALAVNDKKVVINPILVAADDGSGRADFAAYTDYAQKIWDQAGITLEFLAPTLLDDDDYYTFDEDNAVALVTGAGGGQSGDPKVINAWFVDTIINASVYGFAFLDFPYMVMDVSNIQGYSALGRVDTFS